MSESSFGAMQTKVSAAPPFWVTAPREHFTTLCEQQWADHMRGSYGDRVVTGAVVIGYLEGAKKPKGAR